jgi:hypothetical protein
MDIINIILSDKTEITGDILIFKPGSSEINNLIEQINNSPDIPSDVIALPYYSRLNAEYQDYVKNIDKNIKEIKIDRKEIIELGINLSKDDLTNSSYNNIYNRVILVSTNIAEASISISSLKYVIDTGIEKSMIYDYQSRSNILKEVSITEASRKQRRGRVGRTSSGTVYYMYEKDSLVNNKKQFNISIQDLTYSVMLNLIRNSSDIPIISDTLHNITNGYNFDDGVLYKYKSKEFSSMIRKILFYQYMFDLDTYYKYVGNPIYDKQRKYSDKIDIFESGYDIEQLKDNTGKFYIIHPDELSLQRNISGDIINVNNDGLSINGNKIESKKINVFWDILLTNMMVQNKDGIISETKFGSIMKKMLIKFLMIAPESILMLLYTYGFYLNNPQFTINNNTTIIENMISFIILLDVINNNIKNLIENYKVNNRNMIGQKIKEMGKIFGKDIIESDIHVIYNIANYINHNRVTNSIVNIKQDVIDKFHRNKIIFMEKWNELENMNELKDMVKNKYTKMIEMKLDFLKCIMILCNSYMIVKKLVPTTKYYLHIFNPNYNTIYELPSLKWNKYTPATFINRTFQEGYLLFLKENKSFMNISILMNVTINDIEYISSIYNKKEMKHRFTKNMLQSDKKHIYIDSEIIKTRIDMDGETHEISDKNILLATIESNVQDIKHDFNL